MLASSPHGVRRACAQSQAHSKPTSALENGFEHLRLLERLVGTRARRPVSGHQLRSELNVEDLVLCFHAAQAQSNSVGQPNREDAM